jgi:hypothetical protein
VFGTDEFPEACVMRAIKENWYLLTVVESVTVFRLAKWMRLLCNFILVSSTRKINIIFVRVAFCDMNVINFYETFS